MELLIILVTAFVMVYEIDYILRTREKIDNLFNRITIIKQSNQSDGDPLMLMAKQTLESIFLYGWLVYMIYNYFNTPFIWVLLFMIISVTVASFIQIKYKDGDRKVFYTYAKFDSLYWALVSIYILIDFMFFSGSSTFLFGL